MNRSIYGHIFGVVACLVALATGFLWGKLQVVQTSLDLQRMHQVLVLQRISREAKMWEKVLNSFEAGLSSNLEPEIGRIELEGYRRKLLDHQSSDR